jgi:hypothetical protein
MAQVVDSAQWTGISTDPFAALSTEERNGLVRYDVNYSKSFKTFGLFGFFAIVGLVTAAASLIVGVTPTKKTQGIEQTLNKLGVEYNTAALAFGLLLLGTMIFAIVMLNRRLQAAAARCAPLIISGGYLAAGTPTLKIPLRSINAVRFQPTFAVATSQPAFPFPTPPNEHAKLEVHYGVSEPLIVDPTVLNEKPDRLAAVLQYRVLKARGEINV